MLSNINKERLINLLRKQNYKDLNKWRKSKNRQRKRYYRKTQNAKNSGRPWTKEEIKIVMEHDMTDTEISNLIGRSVAAIQNRRCVENIRKTAEKESD